MRAWLAHADVHRIAVFADARDEGLAKAYIKHYGFRLWVRREHRRPIGRAASWATPPYDAERRSWPAFTRRVAPVVVATPVAGVRYSWLVRVTPLPKRESWVYLCWSVQAHLRPLAATVSFTTRWSRHTVSGSSGPLSSSTS